MCKRVPIKYSTECFSVEQNNWKPRVDVPKDLFQKFTSKLNLYGKKYKKRKFIHTRDHIRLFYYVLLKSPDQTEVN